MVTAWYYNSILSIEPWRGLPFGHVAWDGCSVVIRPSWMGFLTMGKLTPMKMDAWPSPNIRWIIYLSFDHGRRLILFNLRGYGCFFSLDSNWRLAFWGSMAAVSINENGCTALRSSYRCEAFLGMSKNHQKHGFGMALAWLWQWMEHVRSLIVIPYWVLVVIPYWWCW